MYKMNHNKEKGITTMKKKNLIMIATSAAFLFSTLFGKREIGRNLENMRSVENDIELMQSDLGSTPS